MASCDPTKTATLAVLPCSLIGGQPQASRRSQRSPRWPAATPQDGHFPHQDGHFGSAFRTRGAAPAWSNTAKWLTVVRRGPNQDHGLAVGSETLGVSSRVRRAALSLQVQERSPWWRDVAPPRRPL